MEALISDTMAQPGTSWSSKTADMCIAWCAC